jgi:hypothetical protein
MTGLPLSSGVALFDYFSELEDPRVARTRKHSLNDILVIAISGVICGIDNWVELEAFGKAKFDWFKSFLALPNGIPLKWTPSFGPLLQSTKRGLCAWVMRPDERREVVVGRRRYAVACRPAEAKAKPERRRLVPASTRGRRPSVFVSPALSAFAFR